MLKESAIHGIFIASTLMQDKLNSSSTPLSLSAEDGGDLPFYKALRVGSVFKIKECIFHTHSQFFFSVQPDSNFMKKIRQVLKRPTCLSVKWTSCLTQSLPSCVWQGACISVT